MRNRQLYSILFLFISFFFLSCESNIPNDREQIINDRVDSLIALMTLEEKVGQMLNLGLPALLQGEFYSVRDTLIFDTSKVNKLLIKYGAGCIQNLGNFPLTPQQWRYYIGYIQQTVLEKTRLKIPVIYGIDAVHGANYTAGSVMFPHNINLAATFEPELAYRAAEITAYEVKASCIFWNYSPVLDIARHSFWGRVYETFGEDTYLTRQMGVAQLKGLQGEDPSAKNKVLACGKHFLGYGAPLNGKDRFPVIVTEYMLRQIHLPPFQEAIEEGLLSIMLSGGTINGIPSHADHFLVTDLLKEELGFKGVVLADWGELDILYRIHKVVSDEREAVKDCILSGVDMVMEPYDESFAVHLTDLVNDGEVPVSRIDDAVKRILYLKYKSGVFEDPVPGLDLYPDFASEESNAMNLQIARESITLLKNKDHILPLKKDLKVLVTGPASSSLNCLNGGWSRTWSGEDTLYNDTEKFTILEAIKNQAGNSNVFFSRAVDYDHEINIDDACRKAAFADVIIACLGEKPAAEKFNDIEDPALPGIQLKLIEKLSKTGKPVILLLIEGRPRIIREIEPWADAVLMAYLPGNEGGTALAEILFGEFNPCGKLPYTYPRYCGSLWTYDHTLLEERNMDFNPDGFSPQYEFGYGLSYTSFQYSDLVLHRDSIGTDDELTIEVKVSNTGTRAGKEVVMLFVSDEVASVSPPVKKLKRFEKIDLYPGQTQKIIFKIDSNDLQFVNSENKWIAEEGYFTLQIGDQKARFYLSVN
ncbi:MAG: glycoside hydrolase family 3 C-terminal domain-containing protein [Bacteroidales bacterium]|nr:glycoside hydrolase family 3 C-terminal domain-containing protein [Bacteroidales bacterium]